MTSKSSKVRWIVCAAAFVSARERACSLTDDALFHWLLARGEDSFGEPFSAGREIFRSHVARIRAHHIDGEVLCYASPAWIADQLRQTDGHWRTSSIHQQEGAVSSTHVCEDAALRMVAQATSAWERGLPSDALDILSSAAASDQQCCAPYREFSRFFLGGNSPFIQLPTQGLKDEARRKALSLWEGTNSSYLEAFGLQWRELAGYAAAHAHFYKLGTEHKDEIARAKSLSVIQDLVSPRSSSFSAATSSRGISDGAPSGWLGAEADGGSLLVATVASEEKAELGHLRESVALAGLELNVLGLGQRYEGHETKLRLYDEFLTARDGGGALAIKPRDVVLLVDAYDVLLSPAAADIGHRFNTLFPHRPIVFAAERTLWPDASLEAVYPRAPRGASSDGPGGGGGSGAAGEGGGGGHPLRFLNCGTVVGEAWALRYMLRTLRSARYGALTLCGPDDQRGFHRFFLENPGLCALDYEGALFQTLHFLTEPLVVDGRGQVLVGGGSDGGGSGSEDDILLPEEDAEAAAKAWRHRPCAIHGNGGDGKPAYNRLVKGWRQALEAAAGPSPGRGPRSRADSQAIRVKVEPPAFSAGIAKYMEGDLAGAEAAFKEATSPAGAGSMEPAMVLDATFNLGVVSGELGKLNEAAQAYTAALELDPNHQGALLNLAAIWYSEHAARRELYLREHGNGGGGGKGRSSGGVNNQDSQESHALLHTAMELVERALAANTQNDDAKALQRTIRSAMSAP